MGVPEIALLWQLIALQCCIRPSYRQSICWKRTLMKVTISFTLMRSIIELQGILQELRASDLSKVYGDCFTDLIYISAVLEWLHYVWTNNSCIDILPAAEQIWPVVCMLQRTPFSTLLKSWTKETPWRSSLTSAGFADGQRMSGHFSTLDKIQSHICQACYHQKLWDKIPDKKFQTELYTVTLQQLTCTFLCA